MNLRKVIDKHKIVLTNWQYLDYAPHRIWRLTKKQYGKKFTLKEKISYQKQWNWLKETISFFDITRKH
jgi:hypothetical protein